MGELLARAICPACGHASLDQAGNWEVCPVCGWEDDPAQSDDPDYAGGANGISLTEARQNYARFDLAFPPSEVGGS